MYCGHTRQQNKITMHGMDEKLENEDLFLQSATWADRKPDKFTFVGIVYEANFALFGMV